MQTPTIFEAVVFLDCALSAKRTLTKSLSTSREISKRKYPKSQKSTLPPPQTFKSFETKLVTVEFLTEYVYLQSKSLYSTIIERILQKLFNIGKCFKLISQ